MAEVADNVVVYGDTEIELGPPDVEQTLGILNAIGAMGVRAETHVSRFMENPTGRAVLFGLLSVMSKQDLIRLGSAVLQFEDERQGRKWIKEQGIEIGPLIRALFINLTLSDQLIEAIDAFFDGIELFEGMAERLGALAATAEEEEEEAGDGD